MNADDDVEDVDDELPRLEVKNQQDEPQDEPMHEEHEEGVCSQGGGETQEQPG